MLLERLMVEVGADTAKAERGLDGLEGKTHRWTSGVARAGGLAFAGVAAGATALIGSGVKVAADMEQARIGFTTLLGSASKADAFIGQMKAFAAKTPFEFAGLQEASGQMLAVGIKSKDVIPLMTALGDATASVGTGEEGVKRATTALTQMQQKGKVTGEEMLQLTEAGIPAWGTLAAAMGTTVADAQSKVTKGQVQVNTLMGALTGYAGPMKNLAGMMDKQSTSLKGMWSTLKDTVSMGLGDMAAPIIGSVKKSLGPLTDAIGGALKAIGPQLGTFASGLVGVLTPLLPVLGKIVGTLGGVLGKALTALMPTIEALAPVVLTLADALGDTLLALVPLLPPLGRVLVAVAPILPLFAKLAATLITDLVPVLTPLINLLAGVLEAIPPPMLLAIVGAFIAMTNPIADVVLGVGLLIAAGKLLIAHLGGIGGFFRAAWGAVTRVVDGAVRLITGNLATIGRVILAFATMGMSEVVRLIIGHWSAITGALTAAGGAIGRFFSALPGRILGWIGDLGHLLAGPGRAILRGFLAGAKAYVAVLKTFYVTMPMAVLRWIGNVARTLYHKGRDLLGGLYAGARSMIAGIAAWVGGLAGRVWSWIGSAAHLERLLLGKGVAVFRGFLQGFIDREVAGAKWVAGLPIRVLRWIGNIDRTLYHTGRDMLWGFIHGLGSMAGEIIGAIKRTVTDHLPGFVKRALHIKSPSRVFAYLGRMTGLGFALGLEGTAGHTARAANALALAATRAAAGVTLPGPRVGAGAGVASRVAARVAAGLPTSAGSSSGNVYVDARVTVQGSVVTERELLEMLRRRLTDKAVANAGALLGR